jgi:hypothetical protein
MDNYIESIEYKDHKIDLHYSDYNEDPTSWHTPAERGATFVMSHKRAVVPCEIDINWEDYAGWEDAAKSKAKGKVIRYVDWYEHGGVAVSLVKEPIPTDKWDSGIVGFIFGDNEDDINSAFNEWKDYVEGNVYDFIIYNKEGEEVDSLCCIYGRENVEDQAKDAVDALTK